MPTYQYACTSAECGTEFELVQSFTDAPARECPVCSGPVRKVFSAVGVVFKGSGFYRTDSRSDSAKSGTKSAGSSGEHGKDSGSDSAKSDKAAASSDSSNGSNGSSSSSSSSSSASSKGSTTSSGSTDSKSKAAASA